MDWTLDLHSGLSYNIPFSFSGTIKNCFMAPWPLRKKNTFSRLSQCLLLLQPKRSHFPCLHAPSLSLIGRESIYEALTFFLKKEQEVAGNGVSREWEREPWRWSRSSSCRESNNKSGKSTSWQEAEPESRRSPSSSKAEWHPNKRPAPNPQGKMRMALSAQEGDRWALFNQDWKHSPIERLGLWGMDPEGVAKLKAAKAANLHLFSARLGSNEARAGTFNWLGQKSFLIRHTAQGWGLERGRLEQELPETMQPPLRFVTSVPNLLWPILFTV